MLKGKASGGARPQIVPGGAVLYRNPEAESVHVTNEIRRTRYRVRLELDGLVAVHAARSVWTALTAVAGIVAAEVNMSGAVIEMDGPPDRRALDEALEPAGVRITAMTVEQQRMLPLA